MKIWQPKMKMIELFPLKKSIHLKVYKYTAMIFYYFTKGSHFCDFLFAFLDSATLSNKVYSYRKEFAPRGANSFL